MTISHSTQLVAPPSSALLHILRLQIYIKITVSHLSQRTKSHLNEICNNKNDLGSTRRPRGAKREKQLRDGGCCGGFANSSHVYILSAPNQLWETDAATRESDSFATPLYWTRSKRVAGRVQKDPISWASLSHFVLLLPVYVFSAIG
jgi:hypothetical protein